MWIHFEIPVSSIIIWNKKIPSCFFKIFQGEQKIMDIFKYNETIIAQLI